MDPGHGGNRRGLRWHRGRFRVAPPEYYDNFTIDVDGRERTYWLPCACRADAVAARPAGEPPPPLLIALHGLSSDGARLAWWSGLDRGATEAGFHCVFPDALDTVWDDHGCGRLDGADDLAFIAALVDEMARTGAADPERVVVTGVSSGGAFAERVARTGAVAVRGLALVVATARTASLRTDPIRSGPVGVLMVAGTGDPMLPWEGGAARGPLAGRSLRRVERALRDPDGHDWVAPLQLAAEWAAAAGCAGEPSTEPQPPTGEGLGVDRWRWHATASGDPEVTLYRIEGAGHGWPNGRQYLPARFLGHIPQGWDATGLVMDFARACVGRPPDSDRPPNRSTHEDELRAGRRCAGVEYPV